MNNTKYENLCVMANFTGPSHYTEILIFSVIHIVMCILLHSIFNEDIVSFVYLCNDRQLIIMNLTYYYVMNKLDLLMNEL